MEDQFAMQINYELICTREANTEYVHTTQFLKTSENSIASIFNKIFLFFFFISFKKT